MVCKKNSLIPQTRVSTLYILALCTRLLGYFCLSFVHGYASTTQSSVVILVDNELQDLLRGKTTHFSIDNTLREPHNNYQYPVNCTYSWNVNCGIVSSICHGTFSLNTSTDCRWRWTFAGVVPIEIFRWVSVHFDLWHSVSPNRRRYQPQKNKHGRCNKILSSTADAFSYDKRNHCLREGEYITAREAHYNYYYCYRYLPAWILMAILQVILV